MRIIKKLFTIETPIDALSIGMFDGVHTGHQKIITKLKEKGLSAILTFENHPLTILQPEIAPQLICSLEERLSLLQTFGIDIAIVIPFSADLSKQPFDTFLEHIHSCLAFSHLILGDKAAFGFNRGGTPSLVKAFGAKHNFAVEYVTKDHISSSSIRTAIQENKLSLAEKMLGRKL